MSHSSKVFRVGTRPSRLARVQVQEFLGRLTSWWPHAEFEVVPIESPGDRDIETDLSESPQDFFTRDLDEAVLAGRLDLAVHSAKDLPEPIVEGLDWFWLPWRADPRDVVVVRKGCEISDLPVDPVIGVSSDRREAYARRRFPGGVMRPIRGNIEQRLDQLDAGDFDVLVMAGAALERLELSDRTAAWISLNEMTPPEGQGILAVTFRVGDARMNALRSLFVKAVRFVGAGAGGGGNLTVAGLDALRNADVCIVDSLIDMRILDLLAGGAKRIDAGKRCGDHHMEQNDITRLIADEDRRGRRVVRLKGGDPGTFGRLGEELDELDRLCLPYEIIPGVSSLAAGTSGTGLLLTRRGVSRGFCALTPRGAGGDIMPFDGAARAELPVVFFMALRVAKKVADGLLADGYPAGMPAAVILDAGSEWENVIRTTLDGLAIAAAKAPEGATGLLVVGDVCRYGEQRNGALRGERVLLTCSEDILDGAARAVTDYGGVPLRRPFIRAVVRDDAGEALQNLREYDWVVLTSPSAVRCFFECVDSASVDLRSVPRLAVCGPGTASALRGGGLHADLVPESNFGSDALADLARSAIRSGERVLRLRSSKAGPALGEVLGQTGADVIDCVLYENKPLCYNECPPFGAALFASPSAVENFIEQGFGGSLVGAVVAAIGAPTADALVRAGVAPDVVSDRATVVDTVDALARHFVCKEVQG